MHKLSKDLRRHSLTYKGHTVHSTYKFDPCQGDLQCADRVTGDLIRKWLARHHHNASTFLSLGERVLYEWLPEITVEADSAELAVLQIKLAMRDQPLAPRFTIVSNDVLTQVIRLLEGPDA